MKSFTTRDPATFAGICLLVPLLLAGRLHAQTAPTASAATKGEILQMEALSVTGSNIKRLDVEKVLPVTVMSGEAMELRNALTPVDMLTALPQVTGVPANETRSASAGARGDNSNINLRGLGASASLILVNGRRLAPHPMTQGLNVNVNQLPTQGISQIEVLRDGASAVYGSDAIAGVVNYIMRTDYRGTQLKVRLSRPEGGWGAGSTQGTLTHGQDFAGGKGRFLTTFDFVYREALFLRDTEFPDADHSGQAPAPFNLPGGAFNARATVGEWPTFRVGASAVTTYFRPVNGVPAITTVAPTRAANPEFYYNVNKDLMALPRTRRMNLFNRIEYDLSNRLTAFADISGYKSNSATTRQPISMNAPTSDLIATMAVDNPFNPYGTRYFDPQARPNADGTPRLTGTPQTIGLTSELIKDLAPDTILVSAGTFRGVAGLKGKLGNSWNWETAGLYSQTYALDKAPNNVRESLFIAALQRNSISPQADPRFAGEATAFNPFGYTFKVQGNAVVSDQKYKNSQSVMNSFIDTWRQDGRTEIWGFDARASGPVYRLWSGDIGMAVGGEWRKEAFGWVRPYNESTRNDFYVSSPIPDNSGSRTVASFYAETVIPLVAPKNDVKGVNLLEITGSGRFERYSDFGASTKPKVGANWKPFDFMMVRASYNKGFTAPSLADLYSPPSSTITSAPTQIDTYRNVATREGPYVTLNVTTGNPKLKPSSSVGKTIGMVVDIPKLKGLSISADYFQISQVDNVGSRSPSQIYSSDNTLLRAYVQQQLAAGTPIMSINTGSGTAAYKGDLGLERFVPDVNDIAAIGAYNAANPNAPIAVIGKVRAVNAPTQNLASAFVAGWDFGLNYTLPSTRFGRISISTDAAYLLRSYSINAPANTTPVTTIRKGNGGSAEWRGNTTVFWRKKNWAGGLSAYYIGDYTDTGATTTEAAYVAAGSPSYIRREFDGVTNVYRYVIKATTTFNAFATYTFNTDPKRFWKPTSLRLSVTNLTNKIPPLSSGIFGYDANVFSHMIPGRIWSFEVTKDF
ncbi:MAG: TonB-dependent receptor [Opitutus sp.]|nr:TonB-dependent receptor [Opitutus sp.]